MEGERLLSIEVLSKPNCQPCIATYRALNKLGLAYDHPDVTEDPEALALALSLNHQQSPVVIIRDEAGEIVKHWSGFRPEAIAALAP